MIQTQSRRIAWLFALALLLAPSAVRADSFFDVFVDLTPLNNNIYGPNGGGPYSIDFALISGDPLQSNTVIISNILGIAPVGAPTYFGSASGDLSSSITLTNVGGDFFVDFFQGFTPGVLSFSVQTSTNFAGTTPDNFSFSILDNTGISIPTNDPNGTNTLFALDLKPILDLSPVYHTTDPSVPVIGPPRLTPQGVSVPEPASLALLVVGLSAAALRQIRRRRAAA